jgi:NAD(P)H-dependent FMN reductase
MIHASTTLVIIGSVRKQRICPQVAAWVAETGAAAGVATNFELVDLRDWPLPMDDEPDIPAGKPPYANALTQAWSRKIAAADAIVFVTPQYNWGYPAPLKNALDHLFHEWAGKPAMIVTYGGHGGGRCAEQLRQVVGALHMAPVATMPALVLPRAHVEANTGEIDPGAVFGSQMDELKAAFSELAAALTPA